MSGQVLDLHASASYLKRMNEPALVLIHGYPFDHTMWDHVTSLLDPHVKWFAPDLPGFDNRPLPPQEPSLDQMADDIAALLEQHSAARAVVAGMSMGGYVALSFAERYKALLAGLALVNSQTIADTEETRASRRAMIEAVRREGPEVAAKAAAAKLFSTKRRDRPELIRFPMAAAEKAGAAGICWALEAMARRPDRTAVLQQLKVPLLIIHGAEDAFVPAERNRRLAQSLPSARYLELPNVGHCSPLEAPAEVAKALQQLLQEADAPVHQPAP